MRAPALRRMSSGPPTPRTTYSPRLSCSRGLATTPLAGDVFALSLTNHAFDAMAFAALAGSSDAKLLTPRRVAVVGGGPAGLSAVIGLIRFCLQSEFAAKTGLVEDSAQAAVPELVISVYEKRSEPSRRQHVFLGFDRLGDEVAESLPLDVDRLEHLLQARGRTAALGSPVELRTVETCLQQLLAEVAQTVPGRVAVRWFPRSFTSKELAKFDDVIGSDGRRSNVRSLLMARIPRVRLAQRALEIEFAYNCHLEWQSSEGVHTLKQHRYESWKPCLLYISCGEHGFPEYVHIDRGCFEAVLAAFKELTRIGRKPYTVPFASAACFLRLLSDAPDVQASVSEAFRTQLDDFDEDCMALITPVEQTLHRAPHLTSPAGEAGSSQSLWLLGDAAVGLPVSKGCNLIYHLAAAGILARALLEGSPKSYEDFVFTNWHNEAWKDCSTRRQVETGVPRLACFSSPEGRFIR